MKYRLLVLVFFLTLPAVAAAPQTRVSTCDVQIRISDGHDLEGLPVRGQGADFLLPCITKDELARIVEDFARGDAKEKNRALDALKRAKQVKVMLTQDLATQENH